MNKSDEEFMKKNKLQDQFTAERTNRCLELMRPEIRKLMDLSLDEKIEKSKQLIEDALSKYKRPIIGFSGGGDSECLLHMLLSIKTDVPVLYVDTRYEFDETQKFVEEIRETWNLENFVAVRAEHDAVEKFSKEFGKGTPEFTVAFNNYHKIQPMLRGIKLLNADAMLAGIRAVEHEERAKEGLISPRKNPDHDRVHPILFWTREEVLEYFKRYKLKANPLYAKGYTSLGSTLDTTPNTDPNAHERAGRGIVRETVMKKLRELGYN